MKIIKHFMLAVFLMGAVTLMAQVPQKFNYQAVARNSSGNLITGQLIALRLSILQGSGTGTLIYTETQMANTNQFGLFTIEIGTGTVVFGTFNTISWSSGNYWLKVEMDPTGGSTYVSMGTSQLLTVPYAMYAATSGSGGTTGATGPTGPAGVTGAVGPQGATGATGPQGIQGATGPTGSGLPSGTSGQTLRHNGTSWIANSLLHNDGTYLGVGTTSPGFLLDLQAASNAYLNIKTTGTGNGGLLMDRSGTSSQMRIMYRTAGTNLWGVGLFGTNDDLSITRNVSTDDGTFHILQSSGNVGINNLNPSSKLDVNYDASIYTQIGTSFGALKAVNGNNYTWLAYGSYAAIFNGNAIPNLSNAFDLGSNAYGFRNIYMTSELNRTSTVDANLVPIAYGCVSSAGVIYPLGSTTNFTCTKTGTGAYSITITGETYYFSSYVTSVTIIGANGMVRTDSGGGNLYIYTTDATGAAADRIFQFVVHKP